MTATNARSATRDFGELRRGLFTLLAVMLLPAAAPGGTPVADSQQHLREAAEAYRAGDYEQFTQSLETAYSLNPGSYYTRYNLARAYALTGQADAALDTLEQLADARVDFGIAGEAALASLRELPRFTELVTELAANTQPMLSSTPYFTFDELALIPEGIALDAGTERLFFGSMRTGEIFVVDRYRQITRFATVEHEGRKLAATGMAVDTTRGLLWVVGTQFFLTEGFDADAPAYSGVFGFDLDTGALVQKLLRDDVTNGFNDVTVGHDGSLYLSGGAVGIVRDDADTIELLALDSEVFGSNGITVTPDGGHLLASSYPSGIAVISLADGAVHYLEAPDDLPLYGIDGMYWHNGDLIAVQNGVRPWRLMRMKLDAGLAAITGATTLEFGNPASTPTTGAISGDVIHHIGEGPAAEHVPPHLPDNMAPYMGKTVIMTTPLD